MLLKLIIYHGAIFLSMILAIVIDNISNQNMNKQTGGKILKWEKQLEKNKNDLDGICKILGDK